MTMLVWFLDLWLLDPEFVVNDLNVTMYNGLCDNVLKTIRGDSERWKSINLTAAISSISRGSY
jgi:hypothetical protein